DMPPQGTFNLHASLLPQYRGAAPINRAIMNGETETGATTFFLTHEIDTGKIILQEKISIQPEDNAGTVHDKLMVMGAQMVRKTIDMLAEGKTDAVDQSQFINHDTELKAAPKIFKEDCELLSNFGVDQAHNFVRGLSPYPGAWINIVLPGQTEKQVLKIFETEKEFIQHNDTHGTLVTDLKKFAKIALGDGYLILKYIQAPGKKRMETGEYLRGLR
ncbi:MAG: methionyl-tRNA formyltransferase, partial [Paludibacter sp.]|nr:methionyl-tRNA formyltransferase [Paludibacter sp.]